MWVARTLPTMRKSALKLCLLVAAVASLAACPTTSTKLTTKDQTDVATYASEQSACSLATPSDKAAIDSCRAAVKAKWCTAWRGTFDAEVCP